MNGPRKQVLSVSQIQMFDLLFVQTCFREASDTYMQKYGKEAYPNAWAKMQEALKDTDYAD